MAALIGNAARGLAGKLLAVWARVARRPPLDVRENGDAGREGLLRAVFDTVIDALIGIDESGTVKVFSPAAERMFGYRAGEIVGRNVSLLMPEETARHHDAHIARYLKTGEARIIGIGRTVVAERRDGSRFPAEIAVSEVRSTPGVRFAGIVRDLTRRRELESQLDSHTSRLEMALDAARLIAWEFHPRRRRFTIVRSPQSFASVLTAGAEMTLETVRGEIHPADRKIFDRMLSSAASTTDMRGYEYRNRSREDGYRWLRSYIRREPRAPGLAADGDDNGARLTGFTVDIDDEKQREQRAAGLARILDGAASEIYVFDSETLAVLLVNETARSDLRYTEDELSKLAAPDVFADLDREELVARSQPIVDGSDAYVDFEARCRRKDGSRFPVRVHLFGGVYGARSVLVASVLDVSAEEAIEERLRWREELYSLTLERAPLGIVNLDVDGCIASANPAVFRITGYRETDLAGVTGVELFHEEDRESVRRMFRRMITGRAESSDSPHRLRKRDGTYILIDTHSAVVHDSAGRPAMVICIFEDVTERKAREAELEEQRRHLAHVSRLSTLGQMAAGLAHEINQPLTAIATYAQAGVRMLDEEDGESRRQETRAALTQIGEQAHRAGQVIRRMRSIAKGDTPARRKASAAELVQDLLPLIAIDARQADVVVRTNLNAGGAAVYVDRVQIHQVLLNLIRNAIDALHGQPEERREIRIELDAREPERLRFAVADRGEGVTEGAAAHLFDPFYTTKNTGMGMGLAISRSIVAAHGGELRYRPHPKGGSVFEFLLPVARENKAAAAAPAGESL